MQRRTKGIAGPKPREATPADLTEEELSTILLFAKVGRLPSLLLWPTSVSRAALGAEPNETPAEAPR